MSYCRLKTDARGGSKQQSKRGLDNKSNCSNKAKNNQNDAENYGHCTSKTHVSQNCWYKYPDQANQGWLEYNKDKLDEYQKAKKAKKDKVKKDKANATKANDGTKGEKKKENRSLMARAGAAQTEEKDSVWYMDSAASIHMTYDLTEFHGSMRPSSQYITLADGSKIKAQGEGTITIAVQVDSEETKVNIVNVQYSPDLNSKLILLGTLEKKGYYFIGRNGQLKLYDKDDSVVLEGTRNNEVYLVNQPGIRLKANRTATTEFAGKAVSKPELWHRQLAHVNENDLQKLLKLATSIDSTDLGGEATFCQPCAIGKVHQQPSHCQMTCAKKLGYRLSADLAGGGSTLVTDSGNCYSRAPVGANKCYGIDLSGWLLPTVSSDQGVGEMATVLITTGTTTITPPVNHHEEALDDALDIVNQGLHDLHDLQVHGLVGAQESKSEPPEAEDEASFDNGFGNELPTFGPNEQENEASNEKSPAPQCSPAPQRPLLPSPSPNRGREGLRNLPRLDYRNIHRAIDGFAQVAKTVKQKLPRTYKQALSSTKSDDWLKGVHNPKGRWVYVEKEPLKKPIRHKARWK
ncbi:GAG-pre-integrase domain [Lasallia pustulata]|uniref:GAG-pre-integrase domain n=1 Tax=Lasallia pustulata TaxID=136370 RepID=A0A1W5CUT7_9LECA|nr:GAG-pre-integrase domain [Lasallia pustulata]